MTDHDPIAPTTPSGPSWRFVAASAAGSLVVHLLVATGIYFEFANPALPAVDPPTLEVAVVTPDQLPPPADEPNKPEAKVEPPKPPEPPQQEPPKPPEPPKQAEKPKLPPVKADPSQVVPATRDKATPPQGTQDTPTNAQRQSDDPNKPNTQDAAKAPPTPDAEQPKPEEPKQAEVKPPDDPKPADANGLLPKQEPPKPEQPKPQKQAATQPAKPPPSKVDGGGVKKITTPLVIRPDNHTGRVGRSDAASFPMSARANGLQARVTVQALIAHGGAVRRVVIVKSSGYDDQDEAAVRAVWLYSFFNNGPEQWIELPVDFRP